MSTGLRLAIGLSLLPATAALSDPWTGQLSVYYWKTGVALDSRLTGGSEEAYDGPFSEFSWYALPLRGTLHNGPHSLRAEFIGLSLSDAAGPYLGIFDPQMRLHGNMAALSYGHAVLDTDTARVEVLAGARHWNANLDMTLGPLGKQTVTERATVPFVGLFGETHLSENWRLSALVSAGGDSAGAIDSEYDVQLDARYRLGHGLWVSLGYRHLEVRFDDPDLSRLAIFGPTLGLEYHF